MEKVNNLADEDISKEEQYYQLVAKYITLSKGL